MTERSRDSRSRLGLRACKGRPAQGLQRFSLVHQGHQFFCQVRRANCCLDQFCVLLEREQTSEHKDTANSALPNILIPVSCFSGGELCVRGPSGQVDLAVAKGPVAFCAPAP